MKETFSMLHKAFVIYLVTASMVLGAVAIAVALMFFLAVWRVVG